MVQGNIHSLSLSTDLPILIYHIKSSIQGLPFIGYLENIIQVAHDPPLRGCEREGVHEEGREAESLFVLMGDYLC